MEHSIQQIALELAKKITKKALDGGIFDIGVLSDTVLEDCKAAARDILEAIITEMNLQIRKDKTGRKAQGLVLKEKERPRQLLTELGTLTFARDYYQKKAGGHYVYPLDGILSLFPYERISRQVCAKLIQAATEVSYEKSSSIVTGGEVSRQTVRRQILRAASLEKEPEEKREAKALHIYADEDHVHLQKPRKEKGKRNQILPLVTVTEGIEKESQSRNRTIRPMRFVDEHFDTKSLWESVSNYIAKGYDQDTLERVYVHGDGGKWIAGGLEEYVQKVEVMDGYHWEKYLRNISRQYPNQNVHGRITETLRSDERGRAAEILDRLWNRSEAKRDRESVEAFGKYLFGHWEAIRQRKSGSLPGSCTEGQVSHVIAERFSRDPQGWGKACLGKLSKLRVYVINGGKITGEAFAKQGEKEKKPRYMEEMIQEYLCGAIDWSVFEKAEPIFDGASGTQICIRGMSRGTFPC